MVFCDAGGEVVTEPRGPCADENCGGDLLGVRVFREEENEGGQADADRPECIHWGEVPDLHAPCPCGGEDEEICDEDGEEHERNLEAIPWNSNVPDE